MSNYGSQSAHDSQMGSYATLSTTWTSKSSLNVHNSGNDKMIRENYCSSCGKHPCGGCFPDNHASIGNVLARTMKENYCGSCPYNNIASAWTVAGNITPDNRSLWRKAVDTVEGYGSSTGGTNARMVQYMPLANTWQKQGVYKL